MKNQSRIFVQKSGFILWLLMIFSFVGFSQDIDFNKFKEVGLSININNREFRDFNNELASLNQTRFSSLGTGPMFTYFRGIGKGWLLETAATIGERRQVRNPQVINSLDYNRIHFGVGKMININSSNRLYPMIAPTYGDVTFKSRERVNQNFNQLAQPGSARPITEMGTSVLGLDLSINFDIIDYNGSGSTYNKIGFSIGYHTPIVYFQKNGITGLPTMNPGGFFVSIRDAVFLARFNK